MIQVISTIKFYDDDIRDMKYYPWEICNKQ